MELGAVGADQVHGTLQRICGRLEHGRSTRVPGALDFAAFSFQVPSNGSGACASAVAKARPTRAAMVSRVR